jgi:chemotaxis protein methyltransferase CheR
MVIPPETQLSPRAYAFLASLVHDRSRIQLGADRQSLVAGRLARRLRELGLTDYDAYCRLLESPAAEEEVERLIEMVATNHTHFFRESAHFDVLAREVLPRLAAERGAAAPLAVWSAAASSGEEPYTLAIVLAEFAARHPGLPWRVHASDISRRMLDRCRAGIYEAEKVVLPDESLLRRHFLRGFGEREGYYRVRPELRGRVSVDRINLFQPAYPLQPGLDVIFCRNVMIYFDPASRQELLDRLAAMLAPGGYLFVGHAESLLGLRHQLQAAWPSVYRRKA